MTSPIKTEKRREALALLKEGKVILEILQEVGISRTRLMQWKRDPAFRDEWNEIMRSLGRVYD